MPLKTYCRLRTRLQTLAPTPLLSNELTRSLTAPRGNDVAPHVVCKQKDFDSMKPGQRLTDIQALERIAKRATQDAAIRTRKSGRAAWGAQNGWLVKTFSSPNDLTVQRVRRLSGGEGTEPPHSAGKPTG